MRHIILEITYILLQAAGAIGSWFGYQMLRIMRAQLSEQSAAKIPAVNPRAMLFKRVNKGAWVLFLLPLVSIAYFVSLDEQPTYLSILILCVAVAVLIFNTTTYILANAVFKFTTMREELGRTTNQLRDTMRQPLQDQQELATFVRALDERVKALEKRSPDILGMLANLSPK